MNPKGNYYRNNNHFYYNNNNPYYNHNYNPNYYNQNFNQINQSNRINQNNLLSSYTWYQLNFIKDLSHNQIINNLIALNGLTYLSYDNDNFYIRTIGKNNIDYKEEFKNTKIIKIIFSSGKLIVSLEHLLETNEKNINEINTIEKKVSYEIKIGIVNNEQIQYFSCSTNNKPIDIFESDNTIILAGNNIIELFRFNNNQLLKISEIKLRNDDNIDNNMKNILCIERINDALICGHASGHISIWKPKNESPFLQNISISKIHIGPINKIIYDKSLSNIDVIISCSSDKTVKVHSIKDKICFNVINFKSEAIDIKKVKNLNNNIYYIVSLKNGQLKIFDNSFKKVFGTKKTRNTPIRHAINIININNNQIDNYILITERNKIAIYKWKNENNNSNNNFDNNNKNNYYNNKNQFKNNKKRK